MEKMMQAAKVLLPGYFLPHGRILSADAYLQYELRKLDLPIEGMGWDVTAGTKIRTSSELVAALRRVVVYLEVSAQI